VRAVYASWSDEPFRGLDRATRERLLERARAWWPRATLLCISHDVEATLPFDRVAVVESGRIVETGRPGALAALPGSRYGALLAQESAIRRRFRMETGWRRLRIEDGRLNHEEPPCSIPL